MFFINTLTIVALFILSLIVPVTSFILPVYKIKKMKNLTFRSKILANLLAIIIIAIISPKLLIIYFIFFMLIEIIYYYFNNIRTSIKTFDRIVITTIAVTLTMGIFTYSIREEFIKDIQYVMNVYKANFNLNHAEVLEIFKYMKENALYYLFDYSMLSIFFTYICLDLKNYQKWNVSFEWLLVYIIPFFIIHIFKIDNFYISNIMNIGEVIFTFYGIKTAYSFFMKYIKFNVLSNFMAFGLAILFPFASFLIGVLGAFKTTKNN